MKQKYNLLSIQAARGVAVVLVMLFHASQIGVDYFHYNFLGISGMGKSGAYTFFFALTGYLMYTLYHDRFGQPEMAGPFLLKRFLRIYPLYWIIMACIMPIYFLSPSAGIGYERKPSVIIESLLLWPQAHPPILGVAWSLSYVVVFYLMFSLLFILKEKTAAAVFSSWITVILLSALGFIHVKEGVLIPFLFNEAHLEFFSGMLVAYIVRRGMLNAKFAGWWIAAGAAFFPLLWALRLRIPSMPYVDLLHTVGSAVCLVGVVLWKVPEGAKWIKPFVWSGDASYTILLASLPALSVTNKLARAAHLDAWIGAPGTIVLTLVLSLGLCFIVYRVVERPLVRLIKKALDARKHETATV